MHKSSKMWSCFVLFALVAGAFQVKGEVDCERSGLQCQQHLPLERGVPGSIEDFDQTCPKHLAYFECILEYTNQCETEADPDSATIPDFLEYLRDACNKESATHAEIEKHLPCLQSHLDNLNEACRDSATNAVKSYVEANEINEEEDAVFATHLQCYAITSMMACYTAQIEESCEAGAKDFVFDAIRRTKHLEKFCSKENTQKHLELLEALELNIVMKDRIKELLEL